MRSATRKKIGKDAPYLAWLHTLPCAVSTPAVHRDLAMSTNLARIEAVLSQRCPDREAIPLCAFHHREGASSHHKLGKLFWTFHGLDKAELIAKYQKKYEEERCQCI